MARGRFAHVPEHQQWYFRRSAILTCTLFLDEVSWAMRALRKVILRAKGVMGDN